MKNYWIIVLLVLFGCTQTKKMEPERSKVTHTIEKIDWIEETPENTDKYIYAVGTGSDAASADVDARNGIASYFETRVKTQYEEQWSDVETEERSYFQSMITESTISNSEAVLPGLMIIKRAEKNGSHYSLAALNMTLLKKYQKNLNSHFDTQLLQAEMEDDPGIALQMIYSASTLLVKSVEPIFYAEKVPAIIQLNSQLNELYDGFEVETKLIRDMVSDEYEQVLVTLTHEGVPVTDYPFTMTGCEWNPDDKGNYVVDVSDITQSAVSFKLAFDYDKVTLPEEIKSYEVDMAKKFMRNLLTRDISTTLTIPRVPRALVITKVNCDQQLNDSLINDTIVGNLLAEGIKHEEDKRYANVVIKAIINVNYSSETALGHCYKSNVIIEIKMKDEDSKVVELATDEQTKAFDKDKNKAASKSLKKLNQILIDRIDEVTKHINDKMGF